MVNGKSSFHRKSVRKSTLKFIIIRTDGNVQPVFAKNGLNVPDSKYILIMFSFVSARVYIWTYSYHTNH